MELKKDGRVSDRPAGAQGGLSGLFLDIGKTLNASTDCYHLILKIFMLPVALRLFCALTLWINSPLQGRRQQEYLSPREMVKCLCMSGSCGGTWRCHLFPVLEVSQLCCPVEIQKHLQNLTYQFCIWKKQVVGQKERTSFICCDRAQRGNSITPRKVPVQRSVQVASCSRVGEWQQHVNSALEH